MIKSSLVQLDSWLDNRTGYKHYLNEALYENVPGGSRWRYVWGSTLVFTFSVQVITGLVLWMYYSPSAQTAWESVYYIQHEVDGGYWLRGIHHWTASAMVVLMVLHLWQVLIDGAYKAPREVNFWLGLILMQIVLGLALSGYLLPWDQKGYWATQVATKIMGITPLVGDQMQKLVVGGDEYGHHTLTRFFAAHAGIFPGLLVVFLSLHLYVFRRHGLHAEDAKTENDEPFWPGQVLKDAVACLATLAVILIIVALKGAEFTAPADPANEYSAARPEWYFLYLFEFLKYFPGEQEVIGAIVIPGAVMGFLFLMPLIGGKSLGHRLNIAVLVGISLGAGFLTFRAWQKDSADLTYNNAVWEAHQYSMIAQNAAAHGIPPEGAARMMREHPKSKAFRQLTQSCLGCHAYTDRNGHGNQPETRTAPDLYGFGTQAWARGLLDAKQVDTDRYFGGTAMKEGDMVSFVKDDLAALLEDGTLTLESLDQIAAALAAEAQPSDEANEAVTAGRKLINDHCIDCHKFRDEGDLGAAPDLTGWGSREWIIGMVSDPNAERFYEVAEEQKMPAYHADSSEPLMSPELIGLIADYLHGQWPEEPFAYRERLEQERIAQQAAKKSPAEKSNAKADEPAKTSQEPVK